MRRITFITLLLMCFTSAAMAQSGKQATLKMGTGGPNGNYYAMGQDIYSYCKDVIDENTEFQALESEASVANILGMNNKVYSAGIVQEDVLQYFAKQDPRKININRMKIISGLHVETVYLLIPKNFKPKSTTSDKKNRWGSLLTKIGFGKKDASQGPLQISLELLEGQDLAAWGGSVISAKALKYFTGINFNIIDVPKERRDNIIMPMLLVGGQPYKPVEDYLATGNYILVGIDYEIIRNQAPFYINVAANYNIGGKATSVSTIGVRALLLGKSFRKEARNKNMIALAQCINDNLVDLADDPDTNPNWNSVYELEADGGQTNWSYFPVK